MTARYILKIETGELFGWYEPWLKVPGMVQYDPAKHGYRAEVAQQLGLVEPKQSELPLVAKPAEPVADSVVIPATTVTEPRAAQGDAPGPDLSDVFAR